MPTPGLSSRTHIHPIVLRQSRYNLRRRLIRDFLLRPVGFGLLVKLDIEGRDYVPATGPTIFIMNHIGAIDPFVVVGSVLSRYVVPMSKIENYRNPLLALMANSWGVYPVRRGEADRKALASTLNLLEQEYAVLIAPEGTRSETLAEAKDGMTYIATKANATIMPVGLDGTQQFTKSLKRLRRAPVTVRFGRPFRLRTNGQQRIPREKMHQMTREIMWQLALLLPEYRRGAYGELDQMTTDYLSFLP